MASWWLNQPLWKILISQIGNLPQIGVKIPKIFETTTQMELEDKFLFGMSYFQRLFLFNFQVEIAPRQGIEARMSLLLKFPNHEKMYTLIMMNITYIYILIYIMYYLCIMYLCIIM